MNDILKSLFGQPVIVKIQRSITTGHAKPQVLVYSQDKSVHFSGDLPKDVAEKMGDKLKIYAAVKRGHGGMLDIYQVVEDQDW